jgi:hypothetical protein
MHLMGRLERMWPNRTKLRLKAPHKFDDPKKIMQAIAGFMFGSPMHRDQLAWKVKRDLGLVRVNSTL